MPCYAPKYSIYKNPTPVSINSIFGAKSYLANNDVGSAESVPKLRSGEKYQALHLLRRLHACHRGVDEAKGIGVVADVESNTNDNNHAYHNNDATCQFSLAETARLRDAVIKREMGRDWTQQNVSVREIVRAHTHTYTGPFV